VPLHERRAFVTKLASLFGRVADRDGIDGNLVDAVQAEERIHARIGVATDTQGVQLTFHPLGFSSRFSLSLRAQGRERIAERGVS
jgi:hypothetical protein